MTAVAPCPECDDFVQIEGSAEPGDLLICDGCGAELELLDGAEPHLGLAPPVEEDWGE